MFKKLPEKRKGEERGRQHPTGRALKKKNSQFRRAFSSLPQCLVPARLKSLKEALALIIHRCFVGINFPRIQRAWDARHRHLFISCFTNRGMVAPPLLLGASFLICFVFRVQNSVSWSWRRWQPQLPGSRVPAAASCAPAGAAPRPSPLPRRLLYVPHSLGPPWPLEVAVPVASFLSNPRSCCQSQLCRGKRENGG